MSLRQQNLGSIIKPGFNPLAAPTPSYTYYLYGWGANGAGQLGLSNQLNYSSPKQVGSLTDWSSFSNGSRASATIIGKTDGTLWGMGVNQYGALGLGNTTYYSSPKQVGALTNWLYVSNGYQISIASKTDGTLWSWGRNNVGQLGLGTQGAGTYKSSPTQVGALTNWTKIAQGNSHVLALKTDGTLWSWGYNIAGQLGLGNSGGGTNRSSPNQVGSATNWLQISAGGYRSHAITTSGTLWSWGQNGYGQLGLGNTSNYNTPQQVGALTTWLYVSAGYYHTIAVKTNGTIWSWGRNNTGQLGLGNTTQYNSPVQIGALTNWLSVSSGNYHSVALKTDGTAWSWGYNNAGQLGIGNRTNYSSPKQVGALTTWNKFCALANSTLGLLY